MQHYRVTIIHLDDDNKEVELNDSVEIAAWGFGNAASTASSAFFPLYTNVVGVKIVHLGELEDPELQDL